jgi:hypothetical protein
MIQLQDHCELSGAVRASGQFYIIMGWLVRISAVLPDDNCCNEAGQFGASNTEEAEMIIWYPEVNIYFMPLVYLWKYCFSMDVCL